MPDLEMRGAERWRWVGRLLPREVRERVFEPAFEDLKYAWVVGRTDRAMPFPVHVAVTWLACLPIVVPRALFRDGHLTRLGRAAVIAGLLFIGAALLVSNVADSYASYDP
ncbi:MAG: hypothetical protein AAF389_02620 [Gemmatimonadota bacterium]